MNRRENEAIERTLREVVRLLVQRDYVELERLTAGTRLRASELEEPVRDYGRTLIIPPAGAFSRADVIPIRGTSPQQYSVRFRLYTREEGESDLELQATFIDAGDSDLLNVQIDNIIVA